MRIALFVFLGSCLAPCSAGPTTLLESEVEWWAYNSETPENRNISAKTEEFYAGCNLNRVHCIIPTFVKDQDLIEVTSTNSGEINRSVFSCDAHEHFQICSLFQALNGKHSVLQIDVKLRECDRLNPPNVAFYRARVQFQYIDRYSSVDVDSVGARQQRRKYAVPIDSNEDTIHVPVGLTKDPSALDLRVFSGSVDSNKVSKTDTTYLSSGSSTPPTATIPPTTVRIRDYDSSSHELDEAEQFIGWEETIDPSVDYDQEVPQFHKHPYVPWGRKKIVHRTGPVNWKGPKSFSYFA